ncbi:MAG: hypothetical protein N2691_00595 [Patescibacteria group bacterium]|nr:hypothetical protein [Patescibacteria group bacterium]
MKPELKIALFIVSAIALFLAFRFWNLDGRIIFDWDQESYAYPLKAITQGDFTLIGQRTTHERGFFLGPHFTYLMLPFYAAASMHPWGSLGAVVFFNLLFAGAGVFIIQRLFGWKAVGFFFIFWALHTYMIQYDITPWGPILLPTGILATLYCLYMITKKEHIVWWLMLGLICGFTLQMHFQFVFILAFAGIFLMRHWYDTKRVPWRNIGVAFAGFAFMFLPLLIFDLRNDFFNSKAFVNFFFGSGTEGAIKAWNNWMPVFANFMQPFFGSPSVPLGLLFYAVVLVTAIGNLRRSKGFRVPFYTAAIIVWILLPVFFAIYGQRPSEYYFIFSLPIAILTLTDALLRTRAESLLYVLAAVYLLINAQPALRKLETNPYGLQAREELVHYLDTYYDPKTYIVSFDVELGREPGFRYLMDYYGIVTHDKGDNSLPLVQVKIPPKDGDVRVSDRMGLQIPPQLQKKDVQ